MLQKEIDESVKKAYEQGMKDATNSFKADLSRVASDVYDRIQDQLNKHQEDQINASKAMVCYSFLIYLDHTHNRMIHYHISIGRFNSKKCPGCTFTSITVPN